MSIYKNTKYRFLTVGIVSISVVAADQLSKIWVRYALPTAAHQIEIISNHLDFIHRKNPGIAFSMFATAKYAPVIFASLSGFSIQARFALQFALLS